MIIDGKTSDDILKETNKKSFNATIFAITLFVIVIISFAFMRINLTKAEDPYSKDFINNPVDIHLQYGEISYAGKDYKTFGDYLYDSGAYVENPMNSVSEDTSSNSDAQSSNEQDQNSESGESDSIPNFRVESDNFDTPYEITVTSKDLYDQMKAAYYTNDPEVIMNDFKDVMALISQNNFKVRNFISISSNSENYVLAFNPDINSASIFSTVKMDNRIIGFKLTGPEIKSETQDQNNVNGDK